MARAGGASMVIDSGALAVCDDGAVASAAWAVKS